MTKAANSITISGSGTVVVHIEGEMKRLPCGRKIAADAATQNALRAANVSFKKEK